MKKAEINRNFDEIVAFAEVDKFIDTPVKHYSSGMYVRLAFSVAAHLEPEILLIDEVLAVGDVAFQRKCLGKMDDVAQQGRTVLFVSHNMALIQTLCQRGILLQDGKITIDESVTKAVDGYIQSLEQVESPELTNRTDRVGEGRVKLVGLEITNGSGDESSPLRTGSPANFVFHLDGMMPRVSCRFFVFNYLGQQILSFKSNLIGSEDVYDPGIGSKFICEIDELLLMPGRYRVNAVIIGGGVQQDFVEAAAFFDVQEGQVNGRYIEPAKNVSVFMSHRWILPVEI
jgi:lipopolysaccharide transport system ATP-binding protein